MFKFNYLDSKIMEKIEIEESKKKTISKRNTVLLSHKNDRIFKHSNPK